jgi:hypothetical protein
MRWPAPPLDVPSLSSRVCAIAASEMLVGRESGCRRTHMCEDGGDTPRWQFTGNRRPSPGTGDIGSEPFPFSSLALATIDEGANREMLEAAARAAGGILFHRQEVRGIPRERARQGDGVIGVQGLGIRR